MTSPVNTISLDDERSRLNQIAARSEQLRAITTALSLARGEVEILEAVAEYARHSGAVDFGLMHINLDSSGQPREAVFSASIGLHSDPIFVGRAIPVEQLPYFLFDKDQLDRPLVFEDFAHDARITAIARENTETTGIHSGIILPLVIAGELQGAMSILWQVPRRFSEQELYIYHQIAPIVAAVFSSLRAYRIEQELRHDRELLFEASAAINEANSYDEIVQAVERLNLTQGDVHLTLIRRDEAEGENYYHIVAASDRQLKASGAKFKPGSFPRFENYHGTAADVMEDIETLSPDDPTRHGLEQLGIRFVAGYPLVLGERVLGGLSLVEQQPRHFSLRDRRLFEALGRLVTAAVERIRLQEETLTVSRAEQAARSDFETLYRASEAVNAAMNFQAVLEAVEPLTPDMDRLGLFLWERLDYRQSDYLGLVAAIHRNGIGGAPVGTRFSVEQFPMARSVTNGRQFVIEDVTSHPDVDPVSRAALQDSGVQALLMVTLVQNGRWYGTLSFEARQPRSFSERDRRLTLAISDLVASAVVRIASQMETQQAEEEAAFMYTLAESINAANTYQDIADAVERIMPDCDGVFINHWEHHDFARASYSTVLAGSNVPPELRDLVGQPMPRKMWPIEERIANQRMTVIEDVQNDPLVDLQSRENWLRIGTRALLWLMFIKDGRNLGFLFFNYSKPHQFSERDRRIALGIGDLAQAASERILAQEQLTTAAEAQRLAYLAEQAARADIEMLYRASEAVNAATNFQAVLEAVEPLAPDVDRLHLFLWEGLDFRNATYFEPVATISRMGESAAPLGTHLEVEQYPVADQVARTRQLVIENIHTHPQVDPITRTNWEAVGIQALLLVPLFQDERWYGTLSFESQYPRTYSERDRRLTLAISDLVTSAVVRIASQMETQQAEEEAAFLYQFAQEVNSATSTQEVADAVIRAYSTVEGVYIQIWEHLDYHRASHYVIAGAAVRGDTMVADRGAIYYKSTLPDFYERVRREGIWIVEDADNDPRIDPWLREVYASINVRATLVLPMLQGERWLASISFRYSKPYNYSPRDLRLMRGIRDVVFAAVERIESQEAMRRAYLAEQDARAESEALYRVSEDINAATTFHDIVRAVDKLDFGPGDIYLNLFENYNYEGARYFDIVATANDAFNHEGERWWISEFSLVHQFSRQGVFINENIPENPNIDELSKQQFLRLGVKSNMRVSLWLHGRWMGGLGLDSALPRSYSEREKRLMAGVGDLVAAAVERIRLQQETERAHYRAQELVALEERNRLARELHDSVSQALYGIGLGARTAQAMWEEDNALVKESIDYVLTLAEAALVEMRALIFELRPESLENEGLVVVLAKQAASLQTRHGLQVNLELCEEPSLPVEVKENLFRVAREALHNIIKHAGASRVSLRLTKEADRIVLQITDNGVGFDSQNQFPGHLGLQSMQERIRHLGGEFDLQSAVGMGTRVTVSLSG